MYPGGFYDYPAYIRALEVQEPLWQPGTRAAYHVHNQGFLLGEILRRVTGMTVGPFLKENVTTPLHAEYYIGGMDEQQQAHVAEVLPNTKARLFAAKDQACAGEADHARRVAGRRGAARASRSCRTRPSRGTPR